MNLGKYETDGLCEKCQLNPIIELYPSSNETGHFNHYQVKQGSVFENRVTYSVCESNWMTRDQQE